MGVQSEILGNHGPAHQIEHNGKVYPLRLIDQTVQAEFEKRWYEKELLGLRMQKEAGLLSEEKFAARLDELTDAFKNGDYEMLSESGLKLLQKMSGARMLLPLIMPCTTSELIGLLSAKQTEVVTKLQLVIAESFPGVNFAASAGGSVPNAGAPAV